MSKTYTLTWKHEPYFGTTLSRCRFDSANTVMWNWNLSDDKILQCKRFRWMKKCRAYERAAKYLEERLGF